MAGSGVTFEGCVPWTRSVDAYQPELLDGRVLQFHDMHLLKIEVEPEARLLTFWFRWDPDWTPAAFVSTPVARLDLHQARILGWDEDPIEPLPAGVGRDVRNISFEAPNFLQFESVSLSLLIEIRHVSLAVLPAAAAVGDAHRSRPWS